ncbi:phosphatidylserine decarboxylase proenzyme, mitochondrial-like isoform X2 [Centruroides sculpturatus]|nr:phosphatidylserine decarboxylase proenzyme, mitochondrial-like isoform X2 [Centruroides sculpturatus]XP_023229695.1 phosphatidylserine decarboxylase proenzyme, mitochondrial-like isoform X2 [Centruroides sculpturatus]
MGFAYLAYQQFCHVNKRERDRLISGPKVSLASNLEISLYKMLPLRIFSRFWGWINALELPMFLRSPLLKLFISTFECNISEAEEEDLKSYHNLGEFFRRALKPNVRSVHPICDLVSPVDGTVLHFGKIKDGYLEQVKGVTYSLEQFLGPNSWSSKNSPGHENSSKYQQSLLYNNNDLYHCVIYLAPGDYHRFHSPVDWTVQYRRHFSGELFSVRPGIANWIAGLFNINERVVYIGTWKYGFFAMIAVGATNVGSIKVYFDKILSTNNKKWKKDYYLDYSFLENNNHKYVFQKGDPFGEFNLGSTVVVIFEAPKDFRFDVQCGQKVKYGMPICLHPT